MGSKSACERKLGRYIDSMIDEMNGEYGPANLTESERVDARMDDIGLRESLICQLKEVIRCRKTGERIKAEQGKETAYHMHTTITSTGLPYFHISRDREISPSE
jgi:hypothetical protein